MKDSIFNHSECKSKYNAMHTICTCLLYCTENTQLDEVLSMQREVMVRMENLERSVSNLTFLIGLYFDLLLESLQRPYQHEEEEEEQQLQTQKEN